MEQIIYFMTQPPTNIIFGTAIVLMAFCIGIWVHNKTRLECLSPVLIGMALVIVFLLVANIGDERITPDQFRESTVLFRFLLAPATVALAIPLYENVHILRKNLSAILLGVTVGVLISGTSILLISIALGLDSQAFVSVYPKSITTAMGLALSEVWAGREGVTTAAIFITGMFGNIMARPLLRLMKIKEPVAKGLACGTSAHVMGTVKAYEMGEVEGAVAGLAVAVTGVLTVMAANFFVWIYPLV